MPDNTFWINNLTAFAVAFLVAVAATPVVRALAIRWKVGDKPNGRQIHIRMIPHLGGVALVLGVMGSMGIVSLISGGAGGWAEFVTRVAPGIILIVGLGLVDDMKSLRAIEKLSIQLIAAALLSLAGFQIYTGIALIDQPTIVSWAISMVFFVGMSSAVNLIDGHDGLAAGVSAISGAAFAVVAWWVGSSLLVAVSLSLVGACAGFLVFNFPPGRIYMGDTGSMFLGTVLAIIACSVTMLDPSIHMFLGACLILAIPMLDAVLAIARRFVLRSPVFSADSLHMHHVLRQSGFSPRQTIALLYPMQLFLAALGVGTAKGFVAPVVVGGVFILIAFASFLRMMIAVRATGGRALADIGPSAIPIKQDHGSDAPRHHRSVVR